MTVRPRKSKARVLPKWPIDVQGANGIEVTKSNGRAVVSLGDDFSGGVADYILASDAHMATQEEAEAGVVSNKFMTPERTGQAIEGYPFAATGTTEARTLADRFSECINVRNFGAVGDGTTDDTDAFVRAWEAAAASPSKHFYVPAGTYKVDGLTATLIAVSGMTVSGDGHHASIIYWSGDGNIDAPSVFMGRLLGSVAAEDITFRDFSIRGSHDSDYVGAGTYPLLVAGVNRLRIQNVGVSYSRVFGIATRGCFDVNIDGCVIHHCASDGINTADCDYVRICDNHISFCHDDGIANHTQVYDVSDRGFVISGNILRFCQGIKVLGARSGTIVGNLIEFCMAQGISVETIEYDDSQIEGVNAASGVVVAGNTIKNGLDRADIDNVNQSFAYIRISGVSAQAGDLDATPGENDVGTGTVIDPYQYFLEARDGNNTSGFHNDTPIPGSYSILVTGNLCVRDVPPTTNLSDYGFGELYTNSGPLDPEIKTTTIIENGVYIFGGIVKNVLISDNVFFGLASAFALGATAKVYGTFSNNLVYDCEGGLVANGSNALSQRIVIAANTFDLDPFIKHSNRGANGTFQANGSPTALLLQNTNGYVVRENVFRNACRISDSAPSSGSTKAVYVRNIVECEPAAVGFSTSNQGIGEVPRSGERFIYHIVDSDPESATYGDLLNICQTDANGVPSTGVYVAGHFVRNNQPAISSGKVLLGWARLTTGAGHVADTDWAALYATIS